MIPKANDIPLQIRTPAQQASRTYRLDTAGGRVAGYCDGLAAMEQAAYKILSTERYQNLIYSPGYGVELAGLFGQPAAFVYPELERRITEALMQDARITAVDGFSFERRKGAVSCTFSVHTTEGDFTAQKEVSL